MGGRDSCRSAGRPSFPQVRVRQEPRLIAPHLGYIYMTSLGPKSDRVVFSGPARGYRLLLAALPDGKPIELTPDHPEAFVLASLLTSKEAYFAA